MKMTWQRWQWRISIGMLIIFVGLVVLSPLVVDNPYAIPFTPSETSARELPLKAPLTTDDEGRIHWLGTDFIGRDVAAICATAAGYALWVGLTVVLIVFIISFALASLGIYFDIRNKKLPWWLVALSFLIVFLLGFYSYYGVSSAVFIALMIAVLFMIAMSVTQKYRSSFMLPFSYDWVISRMIEYVDSLPGLILILVILSRVEAPSLWTVILIISLLSWPRFTRIIRAEMLKITALDYVKKAQNNGLPHWKILLKYILPNMRKSLFAPLIFLGISAIISEASLTFLGLGANFDQITLGNLLNQSRMHLNAWWLLVFPSVLLFFLIYPLQSLAKLES